MTTLAAEQRDLNIINRGRVERENLQEFLSCGDVDIVSLDSEVVGTCVPSNLYPLIALGIPVIFVGPRSCQTAIDIENATAGIVCQTARELLLAVNKLGNSAQLQKKFGTNAKRAFIQSHCLSYSTGQWGDLIRQCRC